LQINANSFLFILHRCQRLFVSSFPNSPCFLLYCDDDSFSSCSIVGSVCFLSSFFHCSFLLSFFASVCFMRMNWWRMRWVRRPQLRPALQSSRVLCDQNGHICIYIHIYVYIYTYIYALTYIYICIYIHISKYMCTFTHMYAHTYICIYECMYTYTHVYIYIYNYEIYTYIYTDIDLLPSPTPFLALLFGPTLQCCPVLHFCPPL